MFSIQRIKGATLPDTQIIWRIETATGITYLDLTAFTFVVECTDASGAAAFADMTSGITGGVGSRTVPSATITWSSTDLGSLSAGLYKLEVTATLSTRSYKAQGELRIVDEVT